MTMYEHLEGAHGRQIFFRGKRFDPQSLFNGPGLETLIDGQRHKLVNVSISGIATLDRSGQFNEAAMGQVFPIQLRVGTTLIYESMGRVVRVSPSLSGTQIGFHLQDKFLDIPRLTAQYQEYVLKQRLHLHHPDNLSPALTKFRLMGAEAIHMLRSHKSILTDWEKEHSAMRDTANYGRDILDLASDQLLPAWRALSDEANTYLDDIFNNTDDFHAAKDFAELVITPELMDGPIWHRAYHKPFGYPGDFRVMDYVYSWQDHGDSLYGKLAHRLGMDSLDCVVTRMSMVQHIISQEILDKDGDDPIHITNVACGSAQEIVNVLSQSKLIRPLNLTLIDQDNDALTYTYERTYPHTMRLDDLVNMQCLHSSFTELMTGGALSKKHTPQDMIYSVGLFDYLRPRSARNLTKTLYDRLAPGGLVVIGNLKLGPVAGRWGAEFVTDWPMIYRSDEEMRELAKDITDAKVDLLTDRTDRIYLLTIRKPKA